MVNVEIGFTLIFFLFHLIHHCFLGIEDLLQRNKQNFTLSICPGLPRDRIHSHQKTPTLEPGTSRVKSSIFYYWAAQYPLPVWCDTTLTCTGWILTLYQTSKFRPFQIQSVCRRQFSIWWKWQKVLQMVRKHCVKRRNCSLRAISPFPTVFSKDLYCRHVKIQGLFGKGLNSLYYKLKKLL